MIRTLLRKLLVWIFPELTQAVEAHALSARLAADVVDWSSEVRAMQVKTVQMERYNRELGRLLMVHERALAKIESAPQDGLSARVARLEMHFVAPISDGYGELDERLDEVLAMVTATGGTGKEKA